MIKQAATALGCRCDVCPLRDAEGPVLPERHAGAQIALVGESPGEREVKEGRPFVGPAGNLLMKGVKQE